MRDNINIVDSKRLGMAYRAYNAWGEQRRRRQRCKDFTFGRQWGDPVTDNDGNVTTEGEIASRAGRPPLTHNLIRQLVKSVVGRWRHDLKSSRPEGFVADEVAERNCLDELDSRTLEEFLISGCAIQRVVDERRPGGDGVWVDIVSPSRFFCNSFSDSRGGDIELVGMLHDMSLREVMMRWGGENAGSRGLIQRVFSRQWGGMSVDGDSHGGCDSGFFEAPAGRCRVIEIWTLESRSVVNCHDRDSGRMFMVADSADNRKRIGSVNKNRRRAGRGLIETAGRQTVRWHCRWLAPDGTVLAAYDSPFAHCGHPFAVKFYPMIDGEVHSLVEDVIDQQRYINRLISLVDSIMSFSAKGVLIYPVESLPDNFGWSDVRSQWGRPDGIVPYIGTGGTKPEQVTAGGANAGAGELLALEMKMMEQVSGVSNALQGRLPQAITSADALRSSIENATVALLDIFETFGSFRRMRDLKIKGCR